MSWWEMMQIFAWGAFGWMLVFIAPVCVACIIGSTIVQIAEAKEKARLEALRDERDHHIEPTNGRDHGKN